MEDAHLEVSYDDAEPTPHQLALAERIEEERRRRTRYTRRSEPNLGNGPSVLFSIETRASQLAVILELYQDSFHIYANEAEVRIELPDRDAHEDWAEAVLSATTQLLGHALRVRLIRPTLLRWLPAEGSIYFTDGKTGAWAGNAAIGRGTEHVYEDWYVPP